MILILVALILLLRLVRIKYMPANINPPRPTPGPGPQPNIGGCKGTQFGCCDDGITACSDYECSNCLLDATPGLGTYNSKDLGNYTKKKSVQDPITDPSIPTMPPTGVSLVPTDPSIPTMPPTVPPTIPAAGVSPVAPGGSGTGDPSPATDKFSAFIEWITKNKKQTDPVTPTDPVKKKLRQIGSSSTAVITCTNQDGSVGKTGSQPSLDLAKQWALDNCPPGTTATIKIDGAQVLTTERQNCDSGKWSTSGEKPCQPWTQCSDTEYQKIAPTSTNNRTCVSCPNGVNSSGDGCVGGPVIAPVVAAVSGTDGGGTAVPCVWKSVGKLDCTTSCGTVTSTTKTTNESNGGTCAAAPTYSCEAGDGACPEADTGFDCTTPHPLPNGYDTSKMTENNLNSKDFHVSGLECASDWTGIAAATACTSNGAYTLSGCTAPVDGNNAPPSCLRPELKTGYKLDTTKMATENLNMNSEFNPGLGWTCDTPEYEFEANVTEVTASVCSTPNYGYNLLGCKKAAAAAAAVDCEESTAATSTCTALGQNLYTLTTPAIYFLIYIFELL